MLTQVRGEAAVVDAGERIAQRHLVELERAGFELPGQLHLFVELAAQTLDEKLLVDGVEVEEQHQRRQAAHGLRDIEIEEGHVLAPHQRQGEEEHSQGQQEHDHAAGDPQAPVAPLQAPQPGLQLVLIGSLGHD